MKQYIPFLALALLALDSSSSFARSPQLPYERAHITSMSIDPALPYAGRVGSGDVVINYRNNTVELNLYVAPNCRPGTACPEYMELQKVELPLLSVEHDTCNTRIIHASKDMRPVDGALEVLQIHDNTLNHCPTLIALPPTSINHEIIYEGRNGKIERHSSFTAEQLTRSWR